MWNLKCTIIPVIIGATGIVTRSLRKNLETVPGKHSIDSLQKTAILGTSHIIRKVLQCEAWSLSGGDRCWFKRSTGKKCLWQETYISCNNNNNNILNHWKGRRQYNTFPTCTDCSVTFTPPPPQKKGILNLKLVRCIQCWMSQNRRKIYGLCRKKNLYECDRNFGLPNVCTRLLQYGVV